MKHCYNLKNLNIYWLNIENLNKYTNLRVLLLNNGEAHENEIINHVNLESLHLRHMNIKNINNLTKLKELSIYCVDDFNDDSFKMCINLEIIDIYKISII